MRKAFAAMGAFVALMGGAVAAQDFVFEIMEGGERIVLADAMPVSPASSSSAGPEKEDEEPTERQKKLAKLTFDRRPSAILDAWSKPDPEPVPYPDPLPEEGAEEEAEAAAAPAGQEVPDEAKDLEGAKADGAGSAAPSEPAAADGASAQDGSSDWEAAGGGGTEGSGASEDGATDEDGAADDGAADDGAADDGAAALTEEEVAAAEKAAKEAEKAEKEAEKAAKEAKKAAEKAAKEARKKLEKEHKEQTEKALEADIELFKRRVTLGRWDEIRVYMNEELNRGEAEAAYTQLVKDLAKGPQRKGGQFANWQEKNFFEASDVVGLIAAAPRVHVPEREDEDADEDEAPVTEEGEGEDDADAGEPEPELGIDPAWLPQLGKILARCVEDGSLIERCVDELETRLAGDAFPLERWHVAQVVIESGNPLEAGGFLPDVDAAIAGEEREVLNLLARTYLARHAEDGFIADLEGAWKVTQAALSEGELSDEVKAEALKRAVSIAPKLREELGQAWLDESFTARPERGMEILSVIGSGAASGLYSQARNKDVRLEGLKLQTTAAEALLAAAPERAAEWRPTLSLLAANWLKEADFTRQNDQSTSRGPSMQRDAWGNVFYYNFGSTYRGNLPSPITTGEMLDIRPSEGWLEHVTAGLVPRIDMVTAQLLLKVGEEEEAFPFIERMAPVLPARAGELVEEFLRVWADNNNPNSNSQRTNQYIYFFGFEQRANAIPLTRSKQERNLQSLAGWIERIRALPIDDVDEQLLARAFTAAHSTAEVYRLETIERVFGDLGELEPKTLSELVQTMRGNLVGVWRQPDVQKDKGTRRREKDIQAEVLRGYDVAAGVIDRALEDHPEDWSLVLARASIAHDKNDFKREVDKDSGFASRRQEAFDDFALAADLYRAQAGELEEDEHSTRVFELWYYAALGACDLDQIDHERVPAQAQFARIRDAMRDLPGPTAQRHVDMFANQLFTRMSNVNPAVKFRYVRAGLDIVGDNDRAREAREVFDYYSDLVTEIRLTAEVDGDDRVGTEPFGLLVKLHHTREIEREAGGFSKYLVNQNANTFSYNYGRPTEDYRDKFEEAAREALSEQFEVHSITFNHPDTNSRATAEYGWRETPYAYLLLEARGPEVDAVPPLRLDLDFLDTTGYAVLPIESPVLPIDAGVPEPAARSFRDLHLTQTLDERQASEGKLVLEVKATALGLVPELDDLVGIESDGFEISGVEDQGLSISEFDREGDEVAVMSERLWQVSLAARDDLAELPGEFHFAVPAVEAKEVVHQRYDDEDLETVEAVVPLVHTYGEVSGAPWWLPPLVAALVAAVVSALVGVFLKRRGPTSVDAGRFAVPEQVTPFTVLGLLTDIRTSVELRDSDRSELTNRIAELEHAYFENGGAEPGVDLQAIASDWVRRVR